jgi:hypothetical protein
LEEPASSIVRGEKCSEYAGSWFTILCDIASQRTGILIFMTMGTSNVAFSLKLICAVKWLLCCSCVILCGCCCEIASEFLTMDGAF